METEWFIISHVDVSFASSQQHWDTSEAEEEKKVKGNQHCVCELKKKKKKERERDGMTE